MITLRKFLRLPNGTAKRKLIRILGDLEQWLIEDGGKSSRTDSVLRFLQDLAETEEQWVIDGRLLKNLLNEQGPRLVHNANGLRHGLMEQVGITATDWDQPVDIRESQANDVHKLLSGEHSCLYLDDLRSPYNVGAIFRSAWFFGISHIALSPNCPRPGNPRLNRTSMGAVGSINWGVVQRGIFLNLTKDRTVYVLETGGEKLESIEFHRGSILVVGNEELGVHPDILEAVSKRKNFQRISIFGAGQKASLNVSVAFGIAASFWARSADIPADY